jgi:hypothetical protein
MLRPEHHPLPLQDLLRQELVGVRGDELDILYCAADLRGGGTLALTLTSPLCSPISLSAVLFRINSSLLISDP